MMSAHHGKLVINAALGYDTYLVMRHGVRNESSHSLPPGAQGGTASDLVPGNRLGCYFCNDGKNFLIKEVLMQLQFPQFEDFLLNSRKFNA